MTINPYLHYGAGCLEIHSRLGTRNFRQASTRWSPSLHRLNGLRSLLDIKNDLSQRRPQGTLIKPERRIFLTRENVLVP
jgi:hypothetical protein